MKRITLFLAVCLGLSVFQTATAVDSETARAANKRSSTNTISTNTTSNRPSTSTISKQKTDSNRNENARYTTGKNTRNSADIQTRTTIKNKQNVKQRSTIQNTTKTVSVRPTITQQSNTKVRTAIRKATSKPTVARTATNQQKTNRITRATQLNNEKIAEIKAKDYSKCKSVYQECMDEFCANKDTNLRRCACSTRVHEFDDTKKQLSSIEEKMLDFNQRLLTVGMDKEDALSISTATEGEQAFSKTDTSESEKLLQKITKTLNSSGDSKITNDLSAISLDLDMDSAWDSVDSLSGISTTAKSGLDLYNAARPICIEMANEICSDEELEIAENNYKLAIQNDCNTVAKAYSAKKNTAIDKVHESSALLDMARLDAHQKRNSDDTLTCKQKILTQLSDESVCGENLYKCLDITGQYIDPSTGKVFLSTNLSNLTTLLTAPSDETKWSKVSSNKNFVNFLNSKKTFLESAIAQCQDLAENIWTDFLDDALAQIKLAQNAKLEEVRRNCLTLISECKSKASKNLEDFDIRALSIFAVSADATVNAMCDDIQQSCANLIDNPDWTTGIAGLTSDISIEKTLENCTTVGKTCIKQKCNSISGNFALCDKDSKSMRKAILNRHACWDEVYNCAKQAVSFNSLDALEANNTSYLTCPNDNNVKACKVAHKIWGDCNDALSDNNTENKITELTDTILYWFSTQTNANCVAPICLEGYTKNSCNDCSPIVSEAETPYGYDSNSHPSPITIDTIINVADNITNYCPNGCSKRDTYGNCCADALDTNSGICVPSDLYSAVLVQTATCDDSDNYYCSGINGVNKTISLYCVTTQPETYPLQDETQIICDPANGGWLMVDSLGNYFNPATNSDDNHYNWTPIYTDYHPSMSYIKDANTTCVIRHIPFVNPPANLSGWVALKSDGRCQNPNINPDTKETTNKLMIKY